MKKTFLFLFTASIFFLAGCSKSTDVPKEVPVEPPAVKVTNQELIDDLLFVNKNNYQIQTNEPATFSAADTSITINSSGLIARVTSGEVVSITVTSVATGKKTTLTAVGATDDNHVKPFEWYHAAASEDPYGQYVQGWETLKKLPVAGETYAIVLRHADADNGEDYNLVHPNDKNPPANWWKSKDSKIARQLNTVGIARARELGSVFKDLNYSFSKVFSSEFYRAIQTAELLNTGKTIVQDGRLNHPDYNSLNSKLFNGLMGVIKDNTMDGQLILFATHHPINEFNKSVVLPGFPMVSNFNWTGAYIVKIAPDKTLTYQGAVSYGMFRYFRDLKLAQAK